MNISTRDEGDATVIELNGRLMGEPDTTELLDTVKSSLYNNRTKIILDFGGVDWLNSTGLGSLISARGLLVDVGGDIKLARLNDTVQNIMNISKLNRVFDIFASVPQAVEGFK
ncbi:STAS domain-containing protein [candidate division KSB1 bacterium]|nr:STAS domain-containing protein [candidate division KSB1 bacterium]